MQGGVLCLQLLPAFTTNPGKRQLMSAWKIRPIVSDHRVTFSRWEISGCLPPCALGGFFVRSSVHLRRAIKLCLSSLPQTFQASLIRFALYVASY